MIDNADSRKRDLGASRDEWSSGVGGAQCDGCGRTTIVQGFDIDPMGLGGLHEWLCRPCWLGQDDSDE